VLTSVSATRVSTLVRQGRAQYVPFLAMAACSLWTAHLDHLHDPRHAARFLGAADPAAVLGLLSLAALLAIPVLRSRGGLSILGHDTLAGLISGAGLALPLGFAAILADLAIVFPADMNVPLPAALLFYPAVAFLVELAFHVLPLASLLMIVGPSDGGTFASRVRHLCLLVATIEPAYQAIDAARSAQGPSTSW
jgi:hypothetical protein